MRLRHVLYKDHGLPLLREGNSHKKQAPKISRQEDSLRQYSAARPARIFGHLERIHQWSRRHGSRSPILDPRESWHQRRLHGQVQRQEGSCHQKRGDLRTLLWKQALHEYHPPRNGLPERPHTCQREKPPRGDNGDSQPQPAREKRRGLRAGTKIRSGTRILGIQEPSSRRQGTPTVRRERIIHGTLSSEIRHDSSLLLDVVEG